MENLDKILEMENLADDMFHLFRRTIGRRRCTSFPPPYCFACSGNHQPCLQSKVPCLSVGKRLLPQTEIHVRLEEQISVDVVAVVDSNLSEGWYSLFLHLTNGKSLDLGELPVVSKAENSCPIFGWCFIDGV